MGQLIRFLSVGRTRRGPLLDLETDFLARIARFVPARRDAVDASTARRPEDRRRDEAQALVAAIGTKGVAIALDSTGRTMDSAQFRAQLQRWRERGEVTFVVGGPDGLDESVPAACASTLSLGPMTLPHELALVVLLEQVFRALAAESNHPYSRH